MRLLKTIKRGMDKDPLSMADPDLQHWLIVIQPMGVQNLICVRYNIHYVQCVFYVHKSICSMGHLIQLKLLYNGQTISKSSFDQNIRQKYFQNIIRNTFKAFLLLYQKRYIPLFKYKCSKQKLLVEWAPPRPTPITSGILSLPIISSESFTI